MVNNYHLHPGINMLLSKCAMNEINDNATHYLPGTCFCAVCGCVLRVFWSDMPGEAMCIVCGTPYQIVVYTLMGIKLKTPPLINVKNEWLVIMKQYWIETHEFMGMGVIYDVKQHPRCQAGRQKLYNWAREKLKVLPGEMV